MASSADAVAVVLYGNLGDWDHAEIVHPGAANEGDPTAEYSKTVVAETQTAAMDIIDDYGVEDVTVVRPEDPNGGDDGAGLVTDALAAGASAITAGFDTQDDRPVHLGTLEASGTADTDDGRVLVLETDDGETLLEIDDLVVAHALIGSVEGYCQEVVREDDDAE